MASKLETEYRRSLKGTSLLLKYEETCEENYQIRMLRENSCQGILELESCETGEHPVLAYNISGKQSLEERFAKQGLLEKDIQEILDSLCAVMEQLPQYFLEEGGLLLDPELIFWDEEQYLFCYDPFCQRELQKAFHQLTEFFVQHTDYQNTKSVKLAFLLHKETMKENYSLNTLLKKIEQKKEEKKTSDALRKKNLDILFQNEVYEEKNKNWVGSVPVNEEMMAQTENLWSPMKRFLKKRRTSDWGDFAGICVEEE